MSTQDRFIGHIHLGQTGASAAALTMMNDMCNQGNIAADGFDSILPDGLHHHIDSVEDLLSE
jgi:hypothetical protein